MEKTRIPAPNLTIGKENYICTMAPEHLPCAHAPSGSVVCFRTKDCYGGILQTENDLRSKIPPGSIDAAVGPLFVEEARPGDTLKIEILKINIDAQGVMSVAPGRGFLGHMISREQTKILPVSSDTVRFNDKICLPLRPMIGVIGVAPSTGAVPNDTPGTHGGNLDCTLIGEGAVLYLPVYVEGALLSIGDLHASMGDGEVAICGVEAGGEVVVRVSVVSCPSLSTETPVLVTEHKIAIISSGDSLEEASKLACERMNQFLCSVLNMQTEEAAMLMSACCDLRICQVVNPLLTVRMELPRWLLKNRD